MGSTVATLDQPESEGSAARFCGRSQDTKLREQLSGFLGEDWKGWPINSMLGGHHLDLCHHASILVLKDVAMEDEFAELGERNIHDQGH
jgi:hypothetical protein